MNAEATFAQHAATWSHRGNEWVSSPKTMHNNNHIRKYIDPKIATIDPVSRITPQKSPVSAQTALPLEQPRRFLY